MQIALPCRFHSSTVTALLHSLRFRQSPTQPPLKTGKLESFLNCLKMSFIMQIIGPRVIEQFSYAGISRARRFMWCSSGTILLARRWEVPTSASKYLPSKDRPKFHLLVVVFSSFSLSLLQLLPSIRRSMSATCSFIMSNQTQPNETKNVSK